MQQYRIRSYGRRGGRSSDQQDSLYEVIGADVCLPVDTLFAAQKVFGRMAPCFLEIGFGSGVSLLTLAAAHPEWNFIGVETYLPAIKSLCAGIAKQKLNNIRIYNADAIDVIQQALPAETLQAVMIFFPDPWQKRRHYARRLLQKSFVELLLPKLQLGGAVHVATDWEDYAIHILKVLLQEPALLNQATAAQYAERSPLRPLLTKFEKRALREGRRIWDLQFKKVLHVKHFHLP